MKLARLIGMGCVFVLWVCTLLFLGVLFLFQFLFEKKQDHPFDIRLEVGKVYEVSALGGSSDKDAGAYDHTKAGTDPDHWRRQTAFAVCVTHYDKNGKGTDYWIPLNCFKPVSE